MATTYVVGDGIRVSAVFSALDGVITDPTSVVFHIKDPTGTVTAISATKEDVGKYHADIVVGQAGTWWYRWEGDGAIQTAVEGQIFVRPSSF